MAGDADLERWSAGATARLTTALDDIAARRSALGPSDQALADGLLADKDAILARTAGLARDAGKAPMIRVHGDFHLGQILVSQGDAYIIDFEGEPMRSLADRRAKTTPLRDVAGFMRSLDYAAASVELTGSGASPQPVHERQAELLARFRQEATSAFLDAYWASVAGSPALALEPDRRSLLDLMLIEKAAYEVSYEATNRPSWLAIPLRGLAAACRRLVEGAGS